MNKPLNGQHKCHLSELHLKDVTLATTLDQAATKIPTKTEICSISLTIRFLQYDKDFPALTEMVDKDDEDGFGRVKLELRSSIREYVEEGVTRFFFLAGSESDREVRASANVWRGRWSAC